MKKIVSKQSFSYASNLYRASRFFPWSSYGSSPFLWSRIKKSSMGLVISNSMFNVNGLSKIKKKIREINEINILPFLKSKTFFKIHIGIWSSINYWIQMASWQKAYQFDGFSWSPLSWNWEKHRNKFAQIVTCTHQDNQAQSFFFLNFPPHTWCTFWQWNVNFVHSSTIYSKPANIDVLCGFFFLAHLVIWIGGCKNV